MSPPIRDGSGNGIGSIRLGDGSEISEVRTGAGDVLFSAITIPDSVVSRTDDDGSTSNSGSFGLVINPNNDFDKFGVRISNNTSGATRLRVYEYSQSSYVHSQSISGSTSGDAVAVNFPISQGEDYGVELDGSGQSYTVGFYGGSGSQNYPITGTDIDIVARSQDGTQQTNNDYIGINDIGNPSNIL